jgi:hypothetical protein
MADDTDGLVARAIESVLDQVPGSIDSTLPEGGAAKLQPWAETAAPVGRNKRPLEELLAELEERVAADPGARATLPRTRHPALAFFDRFGRVAEARPEGSGQAAEGSSRRRRRRRGGAGQAQPAAAAAAPAGSTADRPQGGRRRRRGRGGGGAGTPPASAPGGTPRHDTPAATHQPRAPGSGGRRRRGRRGRGGGGAPAA